MVSANVFITQADYVKLLIFELPGIGIINSPALGAAVGTIVGFAALMALVAKGKPQAGLPFLNTGAILGYVAGCLWSSIPIIPL
ncbi:MAG: presenilin family intramembrane aspartyl protease, partial [ANME-2 cluster archaeon]|nr:presenilin family intramembrane aspartyl protease [ANME-2 cluster archaeon]